MKIQIEKRFIYYMEWLRGMMLAHECNGLHVGLTLEEKKRDTVW